MGATKVYERRQVVADYIHRRIAVGATIASIIEGACAQFEAVPPHYASFMKIYRKDVTEAKAKLEDGIGELVINRAKESDKILELLARSRGNFNPVDKVAIAEVNGEDLDEDSAVKTLMRMLGKDEDEGGEE
jgi:hypothetical protein